MAGGASARSSAIRINAGDEVLNGAFHYRESILDFDSMRGATVFNVCDLGHVSTRFPSLGSL